MLTKSIIKAINKHATECYPLECCGVIVKRSYIPCNNIASHKSQFEINPKDLVKASVKGDIRAIVHSHPDGSTKPSQPDKVQMNLHGLPWVITNGSEMAIHKPDGYQSPLLGREYHHGLMDCYTLAKDYYHRELGITLNDYERTDEWWENKNHDPLYLENFKKEGFVEVDTVQKHDAILVRLGRTAHVNHSLIFIGDGKLKSERTDDVIGNDLVLHHPYGRESLREIYGENWQRRAAVIIRHKSLM